MPVDKTVFLNVAALRRDALAQSPAALQQTFEAKSWRARNEQLDPAVGLEAVKEDPEEEGWCDGDSAQGGGTDRMYSSALPNLSSDGEHQQEHQQRQHSKDQQHVSATAPAASRSPIPAAAAPATESGAAASPRGGCHLVPLLSAEDVQLAMHALQSAAWIQDYVWNSTDPTTSGASTRTSGGGGSGGGGGGGSHSRRDALATAAAPVYREALAAASSIQHPALHSLVNQAVAYYVDPALGEPEDVLRIILELLTACGGAPAAIAPPPSARAAPGRNSFSGGRGGSRDRQGPAAAAAGAGAAAGVAGSRSDSGVSRLSIATAPSRRSLGDARRTSSSCRASPLPAEAAPRSCAALGARVSDLKRGACTAGSEGRVTAPAGPAVSAAGGGLRAFGLRQVAERFLFRSDGSSTSSTSSEAALSVGSSLGSLGLCTNGSMATGGGGGGDAAMQPGLHSCGSGTPHSAGEGAPPGPSSGNDSVQAYLVMTDASYTGSGPTSLAGASATAPAAVAAAAVSTLVGSPPAAAAAAPGGSADGSGHSRRTASFHGSERIAIPSGGSGGGNSGACASGGTARALRALSLHGLRDVFRSHHSSPAREPREHSSTGGGMSSSSVMSDGGGGKGHHHHHIKGLLGFFKKAGATAH
ncbi:hypothetical protein HXX76_003333 [Chlamydomonas incerta]|uniref:Uncharacterized protein n=1 Tax=Chlamydomonas incerta TaxID=51695 RepID=A0A835W8M5_CHLIN|nr:hypothetical protein HXX76_003333 [Chlamydomonas incerta]|eukprot:KAG2441718.1 hypothetical protein HXX76_003333 [Chlamydomonas incerta]